MSRANPSTPPNEVGPSWTAITGPPMTRADIVGACGARFRTKRSAAATKLPACSELRTGMYPLTTRLGEYQNEPSIAPRLLSHAVTRPPTATACFALIEEGR